MQHIELLELRHIEPSFKRVTSQVLPPCKPGGLQLYHPIIPSHPQRPKTPTWLAFTGDRWQSLAVQWCCRSTTLHPSIPSRKKAANPNPHGLFGPPNCGEFTASSFFHPTKLKKGHLLLGYKVHMFSKVLPIKKRRKGFFRQRIWKEKKRETPLLRGQLTLQLRSLWGQRKPVFALNKSILHPIFF